MSLRTVKAWGMAPVDGAPIVALRLVFAVLVLLSTVRFAAYGWIEAQVVDPQVTFPFLTGLPRPGLLSARLLFVAMGIGALGMLMGRPRGGALLFFLAFTYVELLDKTNYLNHYYFVSLMALLLVFLPTRRTDAKSVPRFALLLPKALLTLVYFYAGVAKLHPDWMWSGMPLGLWLPQHSDMPILGPLLAHPFAGLAFSWGGLVFDLTAGFLLWSDRWRPIVYPVVVAFHLMTWWLFPIGVFPWVMIGLTTVFFPPSVHRTWVESVTRRPLPAFIPSAVPSRAHIGWGLSLAFLLVQIALPLRHLAYPEELFWHEAGYRFSWRVMLMEKAGVAYFFARDEEGREREVDLSGSLTTNQMKMVATQPDMLLQAARWIRDEDHRTGGSTDAVRAEVWVSLNGRRSQLFLDPFVDLTRVDDGPWVARDWVLPLDSAITMAEYRRVKEDWKKKSGW